MPVRHFRNLRGKAKPWKRKMATYMKRNMTWPEKILWSELRDKKLGVVFYKQSIIKGFIADFWCPSAGLVVEADGPTHNTPEGIVSDLKRDAVLKKYGIVTMRFTAQEIQNNRKAVVALIEDKVRRRMK